MAMKERSVRVEKRPMWFSDMHSTAGMLAEKAQEGWLVTGLEPVKGEFTFHRGAPEDCFYYFQPSETKENLAVYTDASFQKVTETGGLTLWKRLEGDPAGLDNIRKNFRNPCVEEEEAWLQAQAKEGRILLRTSRPEYTFLMTQPEALVYRIVYEEEVKDYPSFLEKYTACGWEYVWGDNGFHYFVSPEEARCSETPFDRTGNRQGLLLRKRRVYGAFLAFSSGLTVLSLLITIMNLVKYMGLTAQSSPGEEVLQRITAISGDISLNFIALGLSIAFTVVFLSLWMGISRKIKQLKPKK